MYPPLPFWLKAVGPTPYQVLTPPTHTFTVRRSSARDTSLRRRLLPRLRSGSYLRCDANGIEHEANDEVKADGDTVPRCNAAENAAQTESDFG